MTRLLVDTFWFVLDSVRLTLDRRSERQKRLDRAVLDRPYSLDYLD